MADVYFANLRARSHHESKVEKIRRLFDAADFDAVIRPDDLTAIKLHVGERGCDTYIHPVFARQVIDKVKERGAHPFITDTATLYAGSRADAVRHTVTAIEHGFAYAVVGAPVIIADGLRGRFWREVPIGWKHFESVRIAGSILDADSMLVLSHVKGHDLAGFGGLSRTWRWAAPHRRGRRSSMPVGRLWRASAAEGAGSAPGSARRRR